MITKTSTLESLHHINLKNKNVITVDVNRGEDLREYLSALVFKIISMPNVRHYKIQSEHTENVSLINGLINAISDDNFASVSLLIAERLLRVESDAQLKYGKFTKLKPGSVIQFLFPSQNEEYMMYLIVKVEHENFLNATDLTKEIGIPFEENVLKTCLIKFNEDNEIADIIMTDSNTKMSVYWFNDFMEVTETNTDETNTRTAFDSIKRVLTNKIKTKSPSDYSVLHNNLVGFFRTQSDCKYDQLIKSVFGVGDYVPDNLEIDYFNEVKKIVEKLPEKKSFDRHFSITPNIIKDRFKRVYKLGEKIELKITDYVDELKNVIHAEKTPDGKRRIIIQTENEEVFTAFNFNQKG